MKVLLSPWIASILGAVLYLGTTLFVWNKQAPTFSRPAPDDHSPLPVQDSFSLPGQNVELEMAAAELKKERESLNKKQQELKELEARLQSDRHELTTLTASIQKMQKEFDSSVLKVKEEEVVNLKKLAKTYSAMAPDAAALVFKEMEDATIVKIMLFMKDSESAPILEALAKGGEAEARRIARISEQLRLSYPEKSTKRN